ncbi:MAG: hypothetical protein QGG53_38485 [Planctomycetota bacterium]|nr:hypothetical protein [Planctomycetota bacterium]
MSTPQRTHELLTTGLLSGWGGIGLLLLAGGWVCFHLKRELWHQTREEKTVRILFGLRAAIVLVAVWLLCQPMLITRTVWREKPRMVVLESLRGTMNTREEFGALHKKIDALTALGQLELEDRNAAASKIGRGLELQKKVLANAQKRFSEDLSSLISGLPPTPGFRAAVKHFVEDLREAGGRVSAARNLLPGGSTDQAFQNELADFVKHVSLNRASAEKLIAGIDVAMKEASEHPDLLESFVEDLTQTLTESEALIEQAGKIQAGLDQQSIEVSGLTAIEKEGRLRKELAQQTAQLITDRFGGRADVIRLPCEGLTAGLQMAASEQLKGQLSSIFILDDGARKNSESAMEILTTLSEGQVSIHTVLIGEDGAEPIDVGVMALELPLNVESAVRFKGRALVKVKTPEDVKSKLVIRSGGEVLGEVETVGSDAGVIEFEAAINKTGRHKVVVELVSAGKDCFAGNEVIERVIHVHETRPAVMIVSNGLSREFVLMTQIAQTIPHLDTESVAAVAKIGELEFGEKKDQFPQTPKQWERVKLLVLMGSVPDGLDDVGLEGLRAAINNGLQVLLFGTADEKSGNWSRALGLKTRRLSPQRLATIQGSWLSFYSLGTDLRASLQAWKSLPEAAHASSMDGGIPLLEGEGSSAMSLLPIGKGGILFCGVGSLAELRQGGSESVINRLVRGVIEFAAMPWIIQGTGATSPTGLDRLGALVSDSIRNVSDFRLAATAGPLQEMSELGNGAFTDIVGLPELLEGMKLDSVQKSKVETWALWEGWWPLGLILLCASAEYLLRRKAGRVM